MSEIFHIHLITENILTKNNITKKKQSKGTAALSVIVLL